MSKNSDMYVNDTKGREEEVKEVFRVVLRIFETENGWSQERLAEILGINSTTLRKYRREGIVSKYSTGKLSAFLGIDRAYLNGEKPLEEAVLVQIRSKLQSTATVHVPFLPDNSPPMIKPELIQLLGNHATNADSYNGYTLEELDLLKTLLEKNQIMATARAQILRVVQAHESGV